MKTKKKLKLFVWKGALADYTSGCIFALAYSADHARKIIKKTHGNSDAVMSDILIEPEVVTKQKAFLVWGGG